MRRAKPDMRKLQEAMKKAKTINVTGPYKKAKPKAKKRPSRVLPNTWAL